MSPGARRADNRRRHVARIGVVFGQRTQLWWDLPVIDGFDLLRDIYRVDAARYRKTRDELVALMRLERLLDQPVRQLSLGQRMRAEIAAALLHEPSVLFLDEPTIGLDAPSKLAVREFVKRLNRERGVTVLLADGSFETLRSTVARDLADGEEPAIEGWRRASTRRPQLRFLCLRRSHTRGSCRRRLHCCRGSEIRMWPALFAMAP